MTFSSGSMYAFLFGKNSISQELTLGLINAAINFGRQNDADIIEAYPEDPKKPELQDVLAYTGLVSAFRKTGFLGVALRFTVRPKMRFYTDK